MPAFEFQARKRDGSVVSGSVEAADRSAAVRLIERMQCVPFRVQPPVVSGPRPTRPGSSTRSSTPTKVAKQSATSATSSPPLRPTAPPPAEPRVSHALRLLFTEQLAHLLGAGMTLDEALKALMRRLKQPAIKQITAQLHQDLVEGRSFSQALAQMPRSFPPLYVNLVQAGEASGALPEILRRLVIHLTEVKTLRDKVKQALLYPLFLAAFGVALVIVFITVLVPQITGFFDKAGGTLPLPTRILIEINKTLVGRWWLILGGAIALWLLFRALTRSPAGRLAWDRLRLRLPGYGGVARHRFYAQFARTMGTLLRNGVSLLRAVELLANIADNAWLRERLLAARAEVIDGATLSAALTRQQIFPDLMLDMMAVGEQTGRFAETMELVADVFERELNSKIETATALIPPVIIVLIAGVVGMVVFAIMSAVFSLSGSLRVRAS